MRLTVLGKSPSWQDAGGACTSFLVEQGESKLCIDFGSGALGKLRERIDYRELDAIVISHLHADHLLDLLPLGCARKYGPASTDGSTPPRLLAPRGGKDLLLSLGELFGFEDMLVTELPLEEYEPESELGVGEVLVRTHPVRHIGLTHAVEVVSPAGGRIVYGSDGRYSEELVAAARGADVLIAEATLPSPEPDQDVHMSAEEAGRVGRAAGVGRLVLTHISDELDVERSRRLASEAFGGEAEVAAGGAVYEV